jgi:hypothetical protein
VPYGPDADSPVTDSTPHLSDVTAKSAGRTALKWGLRFAVPLLIRAVFRAVAR